MGKRRKRKASLVGQRLEDSTAANGLTAVSWFRKNTGALGGLLVVGIMAGMACVRIASDVCEVVAYRRADGIVTKYIPADAAADRDAENGQILYAYRVDGTDFDGVYPPTQKINIPNFEYTLFRETWKAGQSVDVYFDPSAPSTSTLDPRVEPVSFFFLTLLAPFAAWIVLELWRPKHIDLVPIRGDMALPDGNVLFLAYFFLSAFGSFGGFIAAANLLSWQDACLLGMAMPTVIVPAGTYALHRWTKRGAAEGRTAFVALALSALFWWALMFVFVGGATYHAWWTIAANNWFVGAQATVTKSALKTHFDRHTDYEPIVAYRYEVAGVAYENDRIRYTPLTRGSEEWATGVLQTYPAGAVTRVYYDPENPGESVLNRSYTAEDWLLLAFLMPFVAVGAALIVLTVRAARDCRMGSTNVSPRIAD